MDVNTKTITKYATALGALVIGSEAIHRLVKHGKADKTAIMPAVTILVAVAALTYSMQEGVPMPEASVTLAPAASSAPVAGK